MTPKERKALALAVNRRIQRDGEPVAIVVRGGEFLAIDERSGEIVRRYRDSLTLTDAFGLLGELGEVLRHA